VDEVCDEDFGFWRKGKGLKKKKTITRAVGLDKEVDHMDDSVESRVRIPSFGSKIMLARQASPCCEAPPRPTQRRASIGARTA